MMTYSLCISLLSLLVLAHAGPRNMFDGADHDDAMLAIEMMAYNNMLIETGNLPDIPALSEKLGLTELVTLVKEAGLASTLSGPGPFTVFGPTNAAFSALPEWAKKLVDTPAKLAKVLTFHVLASKVKSSALQDELLVPTVNGAKLRVNLYPKGEKSFKVATVQCAPIDLTQVDQEASNGVIHVIKSVMIPPYGGVSTSLNACPAFKTLVTALNAAKLTATLDGAGPFTVFAPSDQAFAKLPAGALDKLLKNVTALTEVLTYHVVSGTYCSAGLSSGSVPTLNKKDIAIVVEAGGVTVNGVKVVTADSSVSNGVVHVIDNVLIPPNMVL